MKKTLSSLFLLTVVLVWVQAQETTVQVAPSDQVIYPDPSQILNKTEPKPTSAEVPPPAPTAAPSPTTAPAPTVLPTAKPLVAAVPVPARSEPAAKPVATPKPAAPPKATPAHGWFLRWTVTGDEDGVRAWAAGLGSELAIAPLGPDLWEVLQGPLNESTLKKALEGQAGRAQLVRR